MSSRRSMKCWKVVDTYLQRRHVTSCRMYPPKIWLNGVVSLL